jgi:hypothetical protein
MKTIEQAITQAAQVLIFEKKDEVTMLNITISSNKEPNSFYNVSLPKLFVEEFARVIIENHKTLKI